MFYKREPKSTQFDVVPWLSVIAWMLCVWVKHVVRLALTEHKYFANILIPTKRVIYII